MTELTIINKGGFCYIDSREVAAMIGKPHNDLMKTIRRYCEHLNEGNISPVEFFVGSSYADSKGEARPCFLLSKIGCEMVANKLTGEKGLLFTAAYVRRFNEMDAALRIGLGAGAAMPLARLGEYNACARIIVRALRDIGAPPGLILKSLRGIYEPLGIAVLDQEKYKDAPSLYTAKQIAEMLGIYSLAGKPHPQAVSCILIENLLIGDTHKTAVTADYGNRIGISVRYDGYAVQSVRDWIEDHGFPDEIYGFEKTYSVRYGQRPTYSPARVS